MRFPVIVEPDGDEFHAFCPIFKGLHTSGATQEEALENTKNAVFAYVMSMAKHGEPLPCCQIIREKALPTKREKLFHADIALPEFASVVYA